MRRRELLIGLGAAVSVAGCIDQFSGEEAPPATVVDHVADEHGYERVSTRAMVIDEEVEGQEISDVELVVTAYEKTVEGPGGDDATAIYAIISTPSVTEAGQELNILVHQSVEDSIGYVDELEAMNFDLREQTDETTVERAATGDEFTVEEYDASVDSGTIVFDGSLLAGVVEADDAVLLGIGGFSDGLDEREAIVDLFAHTEIDESVTAEQRDSSHETTESTESEDEEADDVEPEEEFPNHIHVRNMAEDVTLSLTLTQNGETVFDDDIAVEHESIETVPEVIEGTGSYTLAIETGFGGTETSFELRDSSVDLGVAVTEDEEIVVTDIAARAADRYERGSRDQDGDREPRLVVDVVNEFSEEKEVYISVTTPVGRAMDRPFTVGANDSKGIDYRFDESGTTEVVVELDGETRTEELEVESEGPYYVVVRVTEDGSLRIDQREGGERDRRERDDREQEEDEADDRDRDPEDREPDDSDDDEADESDAGDESLGDVLVRNRSDSETTVNLLVSSDGEGQLDEAVTLDARQERAFEGVIEEPGEYEVAARTPDTSTRERFTIEDEPTHILVTVTAEGEILIETS